MVVAFLCTSIHSGCGFYAFSLFVKPLQEDFGWGRGEIMVAFTIFFLVMGLSAPYVGRLVDRYGSSKVIAGGAFITGLGFILASLMNNLWYLYGGYIIIGAGMAATGAVPTSAAISNWFKKHRGTAIGIMSTGIGAGGFVLSPVLGGYLIPNFGWKASYLALALISWLLIPLALLVLKAKPADMGLHPDGMEAPDTVTTITTSFSAAEGLSLKLALVTSAFWLIAVSYLVNGFSQVGAIQSQVPHLEDIGFPVVTAAGALGGVGLGSLIGKFSFGWLCDRIQAKYVWFIALSFQLIGTIVLINVRPESSLVVIWVYALALGLGSGGWLPTMSMLVSTNFGLASYGAIFGMITLAQSTGAAIGPLMGGYMYDIMNTYHWAFIIFLALYAVAIPTILAVRRPKSPNREIQS